MIKNTLNLQSLSHVGRDVKLHNVTQYISCENPQIIIVSQKYEENGYPTRVRFTRSLYSYFIFYTGGNYLKFGSITLMLRGL